MKLLLAKKVGERLHRRWLQLCGRGGGVSVVVVVVYNSLIVPFVMFLFFFEPGVEFSGRTVQISSSSQAPHSAAIDFPQQ